MSEVGLGSSPPRTRQYSIPESGYFLAPTLRLRLEAAPSRLYRVLNPPNIPDTVPNILPVRFFRWSPREERVVGLAWVSFGVRIRARVRVRVRVGLGLRSHVICKRKKTRKHKNTPKTL